jgi:YesN/AraC family two-component response regulator
MIYTENKDEIPIYLVDDEPAALRAMKLTLSLHSFNHVQCSSSWEDARKKIPASENGIAVLDILMPGTSGIDALRECRSRFPSIWTIMVTAVNDLESAVTCMKLGASDYLVKPLDHNRFVACIKNVLAVEMFSEADKHIVKIPADANVITPPTSTEKLATLEKRLDSIIIPQNQNAASDFAAMLRNFTEILHTQKAYLDKDISMELVASRMGTNVVYLRAFISSVFKVNFRAYVNAMRIREFFYLARKQGSSCLKYSVEGLCTTVGFRRRATFYEAFKAITGTTPGDWLSIMDTEHSCNIV